MLDPKSSVLEWLAAAKAKDERTLQKIWERYHPDLLALARRVLGAQPRRMADEEDVVCIAFEQFARGVEAGRFPRLDTRDDLLQVLVLLTRRRAIDQVRRGQIRAQKEVGESALETPGAETPGAGMAGVASRAQTPDCALLVAEEIRQRFEALPEDLRPVLEYKLDGYTNEEIARLLKVALRTVERRLERIRDLWSSDFLPRSGA